MQLTEPASALSPAHTLHKHTHTRTLTVTEWEGGMSYTSAFS